MPGTLTSTWPMATECAVSGVRGDGGRDVGRVGGGRVAPAAARVRRRPATGRPGPCHHRRPAPSPRSGPGSRRRGSGRSSPAGATSSGRARTSPRRPRRRAPRASSRHGPGGRGRPTSRAVPAARPATRGRAGGGDRHPARSDGATPRVMAATGLIRPARTAGTSGGERGTSPAPRRAPRRRPTPTGRTRVGSPNDSAVSWMTGWLAMVPMTTPTTEPRMAGASTWPARIEAHLAGRVPDGLHDPDVAVARQDHARHDVGDEERRGQQREDREGEQHRARTGRRAGRRRS